MADASAVAAPRLLTRGGNLALPGPEVTASVDWRAAENAAVYACLLTAAGHVRSAADINPGHPRVPKASGAIGAGGPGRVSLEIDVRRMPAEIDKIIFCVVAGDPARARCGALQIRLVISAGGEDFAAFELPAELHLEAAAILGELYRRGADWKFRAVGQGFTEGLDPLAKHLGCTPHDLRTAYLPANGAAAAPSSPPTKAKSAPPPNPPPIARQPASPPTSSPAAPTRLEPKSKPAPPTPPRRREPAVQSPPSANSAPAAIEEISAFTAGRWALTSTGVQPLPGVTVARGEMVQRELLDVRPDAAGLLWPAQFRHQPISGEPLPPSPHFLNTIGRMLGPAGLPEIDEATAIEIGSRRDEAVPDGARIFACGGTPPRLVAIDPVNGQAWWKAPWAGRWISFGRCPRGAALPHFACGAAGAAAGVFYAGEKALVHLLPGQEPRFETLPVSTAPLGSPAVLGSLVLLPIGARSGLAVAVRANDGSLRELAAEGGGGETGPLGAPVMNADSGLCFWPGATGFLAFEDGLEGPHCAWRSWPAGVAGLPFQPSFRAANGRFWAMCAEIVGGGHGRALACSMAMAGARDKQALLGPHASAGDQTFRGRSRHAEPWRGAVEEVSLGYDYDGRWLLPLLRLGGRRTIVGLATGAGSAREFLLREEDGAPREVALAVHTDNGALELLGETFHIASTDDLELFLDGERLCIHHHESNQCASWSLSFSR